MGLISNFVIVGQILSIGIGNITQEYGIMGLIASLGIIAVFIITIFGLILFKPVNPQNTKK